MARVMHLALEDAGLPPEAIGYVNAHGTATEHGDIAETLATSAMFGSGMPISSLKSYIGHTLGACGALEAWITIEMMQRRLVRADAQPRQRRSRAAASSTTSPATVASSRSSTR